MNFFLIDAASTDLKTAASWWQSDLDYFSQGQQSNNLLDMSATGFMGSKPIKSSSLHLDYRSSPRSELDKNPSLSDPQKCARACKEKETPLTCYYHFTLEHYTVLGA